MEGKLGGPSKPEGPSEGKVSEHATVPLCCADAAATAVPVVNAELVSGPVISAAHGPVTVGTVVVPVAAIPAASEHRGEPVQWRNGLCDCCNHKDCGLTCCCAVAGFCQCCTYPSLEEKAGVHNTLGGWFPTCILLSGMPDTFLADFGAPPIAGLVTRIVLRRNLVRHYNIDESDCDTCCKVFWCGACAQCQQVRPPRLPPIPHRTPIPILPSPSADA